MRKTQAWADILKLAWPLIVANSFWNLQLTIDRIYLGIYSTEALGAAMAVMGVFWVPMALLQQTASYITTFVAQYYGAKESTQIGQATWQAIYVSLFGGVALLGLNFLSPWFFSLVGHSPQIQQLEVAYYNSVAFSALPTALVAVASGFFTGLGQTKTVIGINFIGLIFNVLFDYLLIFGNWGFPEMGIAGAGYATALATLMAAIYGLYKVWTADHDGAYRLRRSFHLKIDLMKQFLKFGLPSGMQWALEGLAFTVFLIIMGRLPNGEAALAASSIAVTIMMLSVLPSMGVAQAVLSQVGQHLGNKDPKSAEAVTWSGVQVTLMYISAVAFSFWVIPEFYISWFKNEENIELWTQVQTLAPVLLKIVALFTIFDSLYLNISFALKGAGDTRFVSLIALTLPWPLMVLPAYLVQETQNAAINAWLFTILYTIVICGSLFLRFKQGKWRTMSVIHPH